MKNRLIFASENKIKQKTKKDKGMKKAISTVYSFFQMMTRTTTENKSDKMILPNDLPMAVKIFVLHNFPSRSIAFAETRHTSKGMMYVVTLNDGIQAEFNENGSWKMVDCKMGAVPAALIPANIEAFMDDFYPCTPIVKMVKTDNGYEVTLSNYFTQKYSNVEYVA